MTEEQQARDEGNWAKPVSELHLGHDVPAGAINRNVEGRRVAGVAGGFGKMWQKTYTITLPGHQLTHTKVVDEWKKHFPEFWPKGANFFGPMTGVTAGDVALLNMKMPGGVKLSTGILVVYSDDESFSFMTPEGHMFNGLLTFSARPMNDQIVVKADALIRAQDPMYEMAMAMGGHRKEDKHWLHTLEALARHFGVDAKAEASRTLVDKKRQWKHFGNIRRSAALRAPFQSFKRKRHD
jgi:hypothetical protein